MNAKQELLSILQSIPKSELLCANIYLNEMYAFDKDNKITIKENADITKFTEFILPVLFNEKEYDDFINSLDFNYNNEVGIPILQGTIWLTNYIYLIRNVDNETQHEYWKILNLSIPKKCLE